MKRIGVCDSTEYGRRLSDWLMRVLPGDIQVYHFTTEDHMEESKFKMDLYLMEDQFSKNLQIRNCLPDEERILILSDGMDRGDYCRWDHPNKLLKLLEKRLMRSFCHEKAALNRQKMIAVYAPFPCDIRNCLWPAMEKGSIYLGFEDIGMMTESTQYVTERRTTADLCYYLHLKEEKIGSILEELAHLEEGKYYVDSPEWFFDFAGLCHEDFSWFREKMEQEGCYSHIYLGFGNFVIPSLSFFELFDQLILLDIPSDSKISSFCEKLTRTLVEQGYKMESEISRYSIDRQYGQKDGLRA